MHSCCSSAASFRYLPSPSALPQPYDDFSPSCLFSFSSGLLKAHFNGICSHHHSTATTDHNLAKVTLIMEQCKSDPSHNPLSCVARRPSLGITVPQLLRNMHIILAGIISATHVLWWSLRKTHTVSCVGPTLAVPLLRLYIHVWGLTHLKRVHAGSCAHGTEPHSHCSVYCINSLLLLSL